MEVITTNSGLDHISEDIFKLLDMNSLMNCRLVKSSWKNVLDQPIFWLKKMNSANSIIFDIYNPSWELLAQELDQVQVYVKENSTIIDVEKKWKNLALRLDNNVQAVKAGILFFDYFKGAKSHFLTILKVQKFIFRHFKNHLFLVF